MRIKIILICVCPLILSSNGATTSYTPVNYGQATADELDAFNRINDFRADPQNELYEMFQGEGYGGTKPVFDALLNGQTSHVAGWWATNFGGNLATWSMDFFGTVPSVINSQFAALPAAGTLSAYNWSDNMGWSSHQYSVWVEFDAGVSGAHTVAGAPTLGDRFTEAGVNWTSVGENVARNWVLDVSIMHMGFGIDWGGGPDGIQSPPGHRNSMLSTTFNGLGIGIVDEGWVAGRYTQTAHFANEFSTDPIFYGYVTDCNTGGELAGIDVELYDASNNLIGMATTDARGGYTIQYSGGTPSYAVYEDANGVLHNSGAVLGSSGSNYYLDAELAVIPEPSSVFMGFLGLGLLARRKR